MAVRKISGAWRVDFQIRLKRYRFVSPENTREGALAYEAYLRQRLARGEDLESIVKPKAVKEEPKLIFRAFAEKWFETYVLPNNKPSTHRSKRNALDRHLIPYFGDRPLSEITALAVEEFKACKLKQGLSSKSINNILSVLRKSLTSAEEWELLARMPRIKWLRVAPPISRFLSVEEADRLLLGAENLFWYAMILCALRTGMRIGELCALDWSDINWERRTLTVRRSVVEGVMDSPKNNRTRTIPMAEDLYELFLGRRKKSGLVFPGSDGNHMRKSSWPWKALTRACRRAELPVIGWHVLRHTFASELTARSVPMKATQMLLGHSTIQMTERYSHLAPSSLQTAVETLPKMVFKELESERNVTSVSQDWRPVFKE